MTKKAFDKIAEGLKAVAGLLSFAAPVKPYPVANADELTARAWAQTGQSIQGAMDAVGGSPGSRYLSLQPTPPSSTDPPC